MNGQPPMIKEREPIYSQELLIQNRALDLWSSADPYTLAVDPGAYDTQITLVNSGKDEQRLLTDRERFRRDDLERYEIFLNAKRRP